MILWFYSPMALPLAENLDATFVVYHCMDDLAGFEGVAPEMKKHEQQLMVYADLVLTGGASLFETRTRSRARQLLRLRGTL